MNRPRFLHAALVLTLVGVMGAACTRKSESVPQPQGLLSSSNKTATRAVISTATAASWVSYRATATADFLPTGRRSLTRDYTEWQLAGTLVARYTATATPTATLTPTRTPTPTNTNTPVPTPTP